MQKVSQGQPLSISAKTWNTMVDAADDYKRRALGQPLPHGTTGSTGVDVEVRNDTGADRREGDTVEIGDKLLDEIDNHFLWFSAVEPDETRCFGIVLEPLPDGKIDRCRMAGVCTAYVDVLDPDHRCAKPVAGSFVLESALIGPVQIIYKPAGTGELECAVLLTPKGGTLIADATLVSAMCADDQTGSVENIRIMPDGIDGGSDPACENRYSCAGMAGDHVFMYRDESEEEPVWVIANVQHHDVPDLPVDVYWDAATGCWKKKVHHAAIMWCDDERTLDIVCGDPCP